MLGESPFRRDGLGRRLWPFAAALSLAFASLPFVRITDVGLVIAAGGVAAVVSAAVLWMPWKMLPAHLNAGPPLALVLVTFLLREGTGGLGDPVDYEPLLILPVLWLALYGSRAELLTTVVVGGLSLAASVAIYGGGAAWVKAALWPAVTALVGLRVHALVAEVRRLSQTDPLTGAANRARWDNELARESARSQRSGAPLTVALIDIDFFKAINDKHGHRAGDQLLQASTTAWQRELRRNDCLARYGGDEFALVMPETTLEQAHEIIQRLRDATPAGITVSVGLAQTGASEQEAQLVARADSALYEAKRAGRGRVAVAT
jgi:diguanylate cyclase (GGDEF)-like protein